MDEDWKILAVEGQHNQQKANPTPTRGALPPTNAHLAYHLPAVDLSESVSRGHVFGRVMSHDWVMPSVTAGERAQPRLHRSTSARCLALKACHLTELGDVRKHR